MPTVSFAAGDSQPRLHRPRRRGAMLFVAALALAMPAASPAFEAASLRAGAKIGRASWYGAAFRRRPTASGDRFIPEELTCAHRTLPLGTTVRVTNLHNGRSVVVKITDRGPYYGHRDIDVSYGAARVLGMVERGLARVLIEPVS